MRIRGHSVIFVDISSIARDGVAYSAKCIRPSGWTGKSKSCSSFCVRNAEHITSAVAASIMWSLPNSRRTVSTPAVLNTSDITAVQKSLSAFAQKSSFGSRSQSTTLTLSAFAESECKV